MRKTRSEQELDRLLTQWAERQELPPHRWSAIRVASRTVAAPDARQIGPDSDWWKGLFRNVSHTLRVSTDALRHLPAYSHPPG
jgi:hypothetical protein